MNESRPATCFPSAVTTASSGDPVLLETVGRAVGEEAREQGVGVVLGPSLNLKRNPLCGRNFEYFSEDPHLAGKLAAGFVRGVEGQGVGTSQKHFACNSQEKCRFTSDSVVDGRTMRELYLSAFEIAVKEGKPSTVMCAYPKWATVHWESTSGNCGDAPEGRALLRQLDPVDRPVHLLMDRAYEGDETRALALELGYIPVVSPKRNRKNPWSYDEQLYKQRNQVERLFRRIKRFRHIFTRYDNLDVVFLAFVYFALIIDALM